MIKDFLKDLYHYLIILRSGLFDHSYYLKNHPDVQEMDRNSLWHFIRHGWKEGKNPSPNFNTNEYLNCNPDVKLLEINPLIHYLKHGKKERRFLNYSEKVKSIHESLQQPYISIIIPVYNALTYVKNCIKNIYQCHQKTTITFEVIVVDNNSNSETKSWLQEAKEKYPNLKLITQEKNLGFGPAVNIGFNKSAGEYLVILNSDTIPSSNWLENLINAFQADEYLGIVSPVTNYVGEGNQIDKDAIDLPKKDIEKYAESIQDRYEIIYEPSRLVFFCVMIKRSVIDCIGNLDEGYIRGNFEDDDYCLRARIAGFKLGIVTNSFVYHHGSATYKKNRFDYSEFFERNRKRFYKKAARISVSKTLNTPRKIDPSPMPPISVIVRTVNRPGLLANALNSLLNQTLTDFEVVLVNDGGPDLDDLLESYNGRINISYVRNKDSHGRTNALNEGISESKGDWIAILDDDDIFYPWHLETMYTVAINQTRYNFFYGTYNHALINVESGNTPIEVLSVAPFEFSQRELMIGNHIPINTWFLNREIFRDFDGFDPTFDVLEDYDFLLKISSKYEFKLVKKVIAEYRLYLSKLNSIIVNRQSFPLALERIYSRYPSSNQIITTQRNQMLELHRKQVIALTSLKRALYQTSDPNEINSLYIKILSTIGAL